MGDAGLLPGFILATILLVLVPGPNLSLILANSIGHGTRYGLLTIAGTTPALMLQLALTSIGMAEVIQALGAWFELLRWAGVAYLMVSGWQLWRSPPPTLASGAGPAARPPRLAPVLARGFLVASCNPKTLLFFSAFLPQFIATDRPAGPQLAVLSIVFALIVVTGDSLMACAAGRARPFLVRRGRAINRLSGGMMMGAGLGLAVARAR